MTDAYLLQVHQELQAWEARGPTLLARISERFFGPLQQATRTLVPAEIHAEVSLLLDQTMKRLHQTGRWLIDPRKIRQQVDLSSRRLGSTFQASDELARNYWGWGLALAGVEGGLTGAAGWPGLLIDVPALYTIALRTTQQIAVCYGYDLDSEDEQAYSMCLVKAGSSADAESKIASVFELKKLEHALIMEGGRYLRAAPLSIGVTREIAEAVGTGLLKRKALQMLPIVGGLVGASFNAYFLHEVAEAAYMGYRRRHLADLKLLSGE